MHNEEIKASDQIPIKSNFRHGTEDKLQTFEKELYSRRNNVKSVFSVKIFLVLTKV